MADWKLPARRWSAALVLASWCLVYSAHASAADSLERQLLHQNAVFVLEVRRPLLWAEHPLLARAGKTLSQSLLVKARLETPEFERVRSAVRFLEQVSGLDWREALQQLAAEGVWIAATPQPNEQATLIVKASAPEVWQRIEAAILKLQKDRGKPTPPAETYQGVKIYRVDKTCLAIVGPRLIAASQEANLKRILDQLQKQTEQTPAPQSAVDRAFDAQPRIGLEMDLETLRKGPDFQKLLKRPADDAGPLALLGGWLDLLKTAGRLTVNLAGPAGSSELQLQIKTQSAEPISVLDGFFAQDPHHALAPLLEPAGTIYSASWYRDYKAIWNQRADLLTESAQKKIEKGNADVKRQFSQFRVSFTPSRFFEELGTDFRVVLARSGPLEYRIELKDRLPAAAVCVSLRNPSAFLEQAEPLSRAIGLLTSFGKARMLSKTSEHAQARLKGLWFRDDEKSANQGNRVRFNFNPTWTVTRGHFILGSTRRIVTQVIDELDRQAPEPHASTGRQSQVTDRQSLSFAHLAGAMTDFRESILQDSVLKRGLTLSEAAQEFKLGLDVIQSLGRLTTQAAFTDQGLEYRVRIRPND